MRGNLNFMIMGDCHLGYTFSKDSEKETELQLGAFDEAIEMARNYAITYLFVPGDLFDERNPIKEIVDHAIKGFASIPFCNVIIACGNHDPYTIDSPYRTYRWPENVFIFDSPELGYFEFDENGKIAADNAYSNIRMGTKGVRIYGASYEGHFCKSSLFSKTGTGYPRLSSDFINIFLMHCKLDPKTQRSPYNPVSSRELLECGFELAVVGDGHTQYKHEIFLNSGILYPRGFMDIGEKGVILGDITVEGKIRTNFTPLNKKTYEKFIFDVSSLKSFTPKNIAGEILTKINKEFCYEIILSGKLDYDENINIEELENELKEQLKALKIRDFTSKKVDLKCFSQEPIFNGLVTKKIWDKVLEKRKETEELGYKNEEYEKSCQEALNMLLKNSEAIDNVLEDGE